MYDEFQSRDTVVVALAQEDTDLDSHGKMLQKLPSAPPFPIVADLNRKDTPRYHRTTAYLIDKQGIVREIFPMMIHHRAAWQAVIGVIDEMTAP